MAAIIKWRRESVFVEHLLKKIDDDTLQGIAEIEISGENTKKWQKIIVKNFYGWSKEIKYE
ncbi:hypothetical protein HMP0721_2322 [Pseudoramibacter alactolyticus ATCC 23263]|uniref:Uncharacterized protein n=1 Tax=Pseudoramibacter alactolyticus ATCC 23263 TaxID=887929 RepID=E6MJY7_9FIRM|nr:hypothetical protein HMP0721_2322 [Pseudoramibacter alactolyticus ATCC 23263]